MEMALQELRRKGQQIYLSGQNNKITPNISSRDTEILFAKGRDKQGILRYLKLTTLGSQAAKKTISITGDP